MARPRASLSFGLGLKPVHLSEILGGERLPVDLFEIHAENAMGCGGPVMRQLDQVRARHEISVHGVGLSIGGMAPPPKAHLQALKTLVRRVDARWFSEHLAWSSHGQNHFNDLLPLPYHTATLQRVCAHIDQLQTHLGRPMLLENPSTYVEFQSSTWSESAFLAEVVRRTGCGLLLDVNNVVVSAHNHGWDIQRWFDELPWAAVGEIHLAGHAADALPAGAQPAHLLIDTHGTAVSPTVWHWFAHACRHCPSVAVVIERDQNIPPIAELLDELNHARHTATAPLQHPALAGTHPAGPELPRAG